MLRWILIYIGVGLIINVSLLIWHGLKKRDVASDSHVEPLFEPLAWLLWPFFLPEQIAASRKPEAEQKYVARVEPRELGQLVGKVGVVVKELRPSGVVLVDEVEYCGISKGGVLEVGDAVKVVGQDDLGLSVVRESTRKES